LKPGPIDLTAVSIWGGVHGLVMLLLEGQISHALLDEYDLKQIILYTLNQFTLTNLA
jgi:hypothetical protein